MSYEIKTKQHKVTALKNLSFDHLPALKLSVSTALLNPRVARSEKTSRTRDLLNQLLNAEAYSLGKKGIGNR